MADLATIGTVLATAVASATGVAAYLNAQRVKRTQDRAHAESESADLNRAQVEGWTTLIATLRAEYTTAVTEAAELRGRLAEKEIHLDRLGKALRESREAIEDLRRQVEILRTEVVRLGGDVDQINRTGKQGPTGDKGPTGDQGPTGSSGGDIAP